MATSFTYTNGGSQSEVQFSTVSTSECFEFTVTGVIKQFRKIDVDTAIDVQKVFIAPLTGGADLEVSFSPTDMVRKIVSVNLTCVKV